MRSRRRAEARARSGDSSRARRSGEGSPAALPSPEALLEFLRETPGASNVREIARAFRVAPGDQPALRAMLRTIERSGEVVRGGDRKFVPGAPLPEIMPVERIGTDSDGFPLARPADWSGSGEPPLFRLIGAAGEELAPGEHATARLIRRDSGEAEAAKAPPPDPAGRADLRALELVTIDGSDARDFDDAVWAEADKDPANPGGWHIVVAIADVSAYVTPGSALDREAAKRGNSVYFPDRVVPMLPEALSNN